MENLHTGLMLTHGISVVVIGTERRTLITLVLDHLYNRGLRLQQSVGLEYLDKQSSVMGGPIKIRSRGSWSHIVSKATDA